MSTGDQQRLYVVIPPSPLFAAHWSFFLPQHCSYDPVKKRYEESNKGRRIHVSGDRLNGFALEIIRDYSVSKHRSVGSRRYPVGILSSNCLQSTEGDPDVGQCHKNKDDDEGGGYIDNQAVDSFETICLEVEAPGPSLRSAQQGANATDGRRLKVEVRDCQWWVRQVVGVLEERGLLAPLPANGNSSPSKMPSALVASLPVH